MSSSVNYYDWVHFFKGICEGIYALADNEKHRDDRLLELARQTFKEVHPIFRYEKIDPFSFVYALAQRNTRNQRNTAFTNAKKAFNLDVEIPTDWIFPTPAPNALSLFYAEEGYITQDRVEVGNNCLWELFKEAYTDGTLSNSFFREALSLKNVGFTKLSQTLFLISSKKYMPFETQMNSLPIAELQNLKQVVVEIEKKGVQVYLNVIAELKKSFPGCELYEINLLNVLTNSNKGDYLKISYKYYQISSFAQGSEEPDYFDDFVQYNAVWVGGPSSSTGKTEYPIYNVQRGDIVLVRRGWVMFGGIAVVIDNEYADDIYTDEKAIKVIWLIKKDYNLHENFLGQRDGFSHASGKTIERFKEAYPMAFQILDEIRNKQRIMVNHAIVNYKNLILQGPPGTGKTRLAKQIALWLTDESEKELSLIEIIDKNLFAKEPDPDIEANEQIKLIQFHPSYTYEDFVRGIKASAEGNRLKYEVENRILAKLAETAGKPENQHKAFVLIIDEINRANLSSVLGELIYALEYRGEPVETIYKYGDSNEIRIPENLYIIGTMNTADRSVSAIDYAIRRRFKFISVLCSDEPITNAKAKNLYQEVKRIFDEFTSPEFNKDDIQIGHSYFLCDDDELPVKLKYEIKPLLLEYVKDGILLEESREKIQKL